MDTMSIYIDETLGSRDISNLKDVLYGIPHIVNVEINPSEPHHVMIEYEAHYNIPVIVLNQLSEQGLHSDVQPC